MNPLLDNEFLIKLNNDKNRTTYARIISLNQYEHPIEQLEGVVTAGSITIDGESAVRRICSLTLSAKNLNINNVYWGLTTKVKIEIGLQNNIVGYESYGNIIWFKLGVFILTDFKTTQTLNNYTISLNGKDKMCLLNGDVSGNLPATVRFDSYTDASEQYYQISSSDTYIKDEGYYYNNFTDEAAEKAVLAGFQERYGDDYQYIHSAKNILTLQYITGEESNINKVSISFGYSDNFTPLKTLVADQTTSASGKITYDINIEDKDIYGFIAKGLSKNDKFVWTIEQRIPIPIIIKELLHQFGQEKYSNIIIKNIEPYGLEMLDNKFKKDLYLLHDGDTYTNIVTFDTLIENYELYKAQGDSKLYKIDEDGNKQLLEDIIFRNYIDEDDISLVDILNGSTVSKEVLSPTEIVEKTNINKTYTILPILEDETAGYGMTLLVYPDELIGQPGDSITSVLDKLVNMLGNYEYFYNLDGQFVFQAKPAYLRTAWNGFIYSNDENYIEPSKLASNTAYTFDNAMLTVQYQNTPNINNIKNDYIIWGERKNLSGNTVKFHGRYAIENPPMEYTDFNGITWAANRKESFLAAVQKKVESATKNFKRTYNYPEGLDSNWWEVNDWANYYSSCFNIDLSHNASMMQNYSLEKCSIEKGSNFYQAFLGKYGELPNTANYQTDIVVVVYTDTKKTKIKSISAHGTCTHYYAQFMDITTLNQGWGYDSASPSGISSIYNTYNTSEKYMLENGITLSWGYNPNYVDAFIYCPILPTENLNDLSSEIISSISEGSIKNANGALRSYAIEDDVDWRHLIHLMADDWYQHHNEDDYEINLRQNNCWPDMNIDLFPYGRTGYEQYYLDFTSNGGFWQDLYDIYTISKKYYDTHSSLILGEENQYNQNKYELAKTILENKDYGSQFFSGGSYKYWNRNVIENPELLTFWFDFFKADEMGIGKFATTVIGDRPKTINDSTIKTIIYRDTPDVIYCNWTEYLTYKNSFVLKDGYKYIIIDPNGNGLLAEDVEQLNTNINEILYSLYYDNEKEFSLKEITFEDFYEQVNPSTHNKESILNYLETFSFIPDISDKFPYTESEFPKSIKENFIRSIRNKTVHDQADDMLYQYSYYNDTVNINAVPIYYLQPNTIISIKDELSKIIGYYIMNKINISLAYNGMMSITAIKSPERIY